MLALPLLVTTLALTPSGGDSRFELSLGTDIQASPVVYPDIGGSPASSALFTSGEGHGGLTAFSRRVVDDAAPPSLQPFLQRVGTLHISGGGGGSSFSPAEGSPIARDESAFGHVDVSAEAYFTRWFYGYLSAGVGYSNELVVTTLANSTLATSLTIPIDVALGLRLGDVLVTAGWRVTPTRDNSDSFQVPFWGGATLHGYAVVRRRVSLSAGVDVEDHGAFAYGGATVYLLRRFGVGAFVRGGQLHPDSVAYATDHAGAGLSFEAWSSARAAFAVSYSLDWYRFRSDAGGETVQTDYANIISLSIRLRPR